MCGCKMEKQNQKQNTVDLELKINNLKIKYDILMHFKTPQKTVHIQRVRGTNRQEVTAGKRTGMRLSL